jgi:hypothetical protein
MGPEAEKDERMVARTPQAQRALPEEPDRDEGRERGVDEGEAADVGGHSRQTDVNKPR